MDKPIPPKLPQTVGKMDEEDITDHIGIRCLFHDNYHDMPLQECSEPGCVELRALGDERKSRQNAGTWTKVSRQADVRQVV